MKDLIAGLIQTAEKLGALPGLTVVLVKFSREDGAEVMMTDASVCGIHASGKVIMLPILFDPQDTEIRKEFNRLVSKSVPESAPLNLCGKMALLPPDHVVECQIDEIKFS